jgi:putative cell wall-binding protein
MGKDLKSSGLKYLIATMTIVSLLFGVSSALATEVLLVSDNSADCLTANSLGEVLNDNVIITTPWGEYTNETWDTILVEEPEIVYIIGGPVAIPTEYDDKLDEYNITYARLNGSNRYETNQEVIDKFLEKFRDANITNITIVYGEDINENCSGYGFVILTNGTNLSIDNDTLDDLNITNETNITVIENPLFNGSALVKRLNNRGFMVSTQAMPGWVLQNKVQNTRQFLIRKMNQLNTYGQNMTNDSNYQALQNKLAEIDGYIEDEDYVNAYAAEIELQSMISQYKFTSKKTLKTTGIQM